MRVKGDEDRGKACMAYLIIWRVTNTLNGLAKFCRIASGEEAVH